MTDISLEGLSDKQLRLFAVRCARRVQHLTTDRRSVAALDVVERHANGQATYEELRTAARAAWDAAWDAARDAAGAAPCAAADAAWAAAWATETAADAAWAAGAAARAAADAVWAAARATETAADAAWAAGAAARDVELAEQQKILDEIRRATVMTLKDPFELAAKEEYFKLLELAAKAAGIWDETDPSNGMLKPTGQYWDPLRDDGDALRLAATLGLVVDCSNLSAALPYKRGVRWLDQTMSNMELLRRAIVFAASQIGKQQEQL